jgi:uncharacterized protein (TIGR02284 family)
MAQRTERTVLNHLIETCRDAERGFLTASGHVENPKLKALFEQMASQRARIAGDLAPHAQRLGGDPPADGTAGAALHRGWIDIKSRLRRHDDNAILDEVERGDSITLHAFQDALEGMLPPDSREVIERLYGELREAHAAIASVDRVRQVPTS